MIARFKIWLGSTLTRKFTLLLVCFLALQTIQLSVGVFSLLHLGEEGALINDAGKQRTRLLFIHLLVDKAVDAELTSADQEQFTSLLAEQDAVFARLRRHAEKPLHGYLGKSLAAARAHWENSVKPLLAVPQLFDAGTARAVEARLAVLTQEQLALLDRVVEEYQRNSSDDARDLALFQAIMLGLNAFLGIVGLVLIRRTVVQPLRDFIGVTDRIAAGAYHQRVIVSSHDELGKLSENLNRMAAAVDEKTAHLAALNQIAVAITSSLSLKDILGEIMRRGVILTASQAACIAFYDPVAAKFSEWVTHGLSEHFVRNISFRPGGLADEAFSANGAHILSNDRPETRHKLSKLSRDEGIRSFICLPLTSHASRLGVIYFYRADRDTFTPDEIDLLRTFSSLAAGAIEGAKLQDHLAELARTDALTGLANRREFDARLAGEHARAQRYGKPYAFMMLDIDRFKQINDTYGHAAGDAVLKVLADVIRKQLRDADIPARYGGEEFAMILPETSGGAAKGVAERMRRAVAATPFRLPDGREIGITVSIGVSCYPNGADTPQGVVERADQALYVAKEAGRNRVSLYREETEGADRT